MKIKDIIANEYKCGELSLNEKYYLFIEELGVDENKKDILLELHTNTKHKKGNTFCCNCLEYINHNFTSETNIQEVRDYATKVIKHFECV